jgi:hypothetical protein
VISQRITFAIFIAGIAACAPSSWRPVNDNYELILPDAEYRKRLEDWFNCDECVNGQLRRVQELGNAAVPDLIDARSGTIIEVASVDIALADDMTVLAARCARLQSDLPAGATPAETCPQYIARFEANRDRRYRSRATQALLAIRTRSACAALGVDPNGVPLCEVVPPFFPPVFELATERSTRRIGIDP